MRTRWSHGLFADGLPVQPIRHEEAALTNDSNGSVIMPIVASWQRELLDFALEHAQGRDGRFFLPRAKCCRGLPLQGACSASGHAQH